NTPVLDDATVTAILDGVSDALIGNGPNSLVTKAVDLITQGIYDLAVTLDVEVGLSVNYLLGTLDVAKGPITVNTSIGSLIGAEGYDAPVVNVEGVTRLPGLPMPVTIGTLLQPVVDLLTSTLTTIGGEILDPLVSTAVQNVQPALMTVVEGVAAPVISAL